MSVIALHQKQVKKRVTFFITSTNVFFYFWDRNAFFNVLNFFLNVYYIYDTKDVCGCVVYRRSRDG